MTELLPTETISSAFIGGVIYDYMKSSGVMYLNSCKELFSKNDLTSEDIELIDKDLENIGMKDLSSKENLIKYFESAPNTQKVINKYQNNITHKGTGDLYISKDNSTQNIKNIKTETYIENQTQYYSTQKEELKKH